MPVVDVFTSPTPSAYQLVPVTLMELWTGASPMVIEIFIAVWHSTRIASKVPASTVTDSTPVALQSLVTWLLAGKAVPLMVCVPSRVRDCDQVSPALIVAGRVTPLRSLVSKSTETLFPALTLAEAPLGGLSAIRLPS